MARDLDSGPGPEDRGDAAVDPWADAALAAALVAVDPHGLGGALVRARPGPARDAWEAQLRALLPASAPVRRVPASVSDDRLIGGLDLAGTLSAGRPVWSAGLMAEADGGLLLLPMAERASAGLAALLARALDIGETAVERDGRSAVHAARIGLIALDEGAEPDERAPDALAERLAFRIDLSGIARSGIGAPAASAGEIAEARARLPGIAVDPAATEALVRAAAALGVDSLRGPILAARAARAAAALFDTGAAEELEATLAARLVLGPRATRMPEPPAEEEREPEQTPPPPDEARGEDDPADPPKDAESTRPMEDMVLDAALAALPPDLLAALAAGAQRRPTEAGVREGLPRGGARLDLIGTLRTAAPWQRLRGRAPGGPVRVRAGDFRVKRFVKRGESTLIFVVDASGSAALARLAEAKGAIELMLAEAYVRREQVALIAFRGKSAEGAQLLLPPTRSLVQAKSRLAALPGGGGTPLAAGLEAGLALADQTRRRGAAPFLILLTDGRANVARDGTPGRGRAAEDAAAAARALRAAGVASLLIDTSARPAPQAATLAAEMGARCLALPRADAAALAASARAAADAALSPMVGG